MKRTEEFETKAEANAFSQGVQFVNDSAITVERIYQRRADKKWVVVMEDTDYEE